MDHFEKVDGLPKWRRLSWWATGTAGLAFALWLVAYLAGLAPWFGFLEESYQHPPASAMTSVERGLLGVTFGPRSFVFLAGQEVYVDYDVTVRRGVVHFGVKDLSGVGQAPSHTVATSGTGTASVLISRTGYYDIYIHPTGTDGSLSGHDVDISASWGARWP